MLADGDGHVLPLGTSFGADGAGGRVDMHASHAQGPQQHRVLQRLERPGSVAGALRSDAHSP
jgi:hypothetical protein